MKKNIKKSIISMMVIMVMVIAMVGCNKETTENTPNETIDETISSEITETTTEVVSEEVEDTKVEISRDSIPCECCNGVVHYYVETFYVESDTEIPEEYKYTTTTYPESNIDYQDNVIYGKLTEDIDFYNYSQIGDFIYLCGYITKDSNVKIYTNSDNKDWVIISTECGYRKVKYEDIMTNNLYVEVDEFKFSYEEEPIEVAENDTSDSETTTENTSSNVQPEQPSNNEPTVVQPTTEEQVTPPPSTPTTEEVVVEPTPEPEPEPTVTADQIVAEFNSAYIANGMTPAPDGPSGLGYDSVRCHAGNYVDQAWSCASFESSFGTKYFYITISDNGDGSFMVTIYTG